MSDKYENVTDFLLYYNSSDVWFELWTTEVVPAQVLLNLVWNEVVYESTLAWNRSEI